MDSRTRYVLPPVIPADSPAAADPSYSSMIPGAVWESRGDFTDIRYEISTGDDAGIAKITINRPEVRNAFRPQTLFELQTAFNLARDDDQVGVIILTGQGDLAFCSGGDQKIRGNAGYADEKGVNKLNVLDFQRDLATAQANELRATVDYNKSLSNFARHKATTLERYNLQRKTGTTIHHGDGYTVAHPQ